MISDAFPGPLSDQVLFHAFLPTLPTKFQEHIIAQGIGTFEETVQRVRNLIQSEKFQQPVRQVSTAQRPCQEDGKSSPDMLEQIMGRIEDIEQRMSEERRWRSRGGAGAGGAVLSASEVTLRPSPGPASVVGILITSGRAVPHMTAFVPDVVDGGTPSRWVGLGETGEGSPSRAASTGDPSSCGGKRCCRR